MEKWDTREAPNRRVRRAMEEENKKLRDAAKKARNEEIRTIVEFVKKRDKRVQVSAKPAQGCARPEAFGTCEALKNSILITLSKLFQN